MKKDRPKIAIDLRLIEASGIGTYLKQIVPIVLNTLGDYNFVLLGNPSHLDKINLLNFPNVDFLNYNKSIYSLAEQLVLPFILPKDLKLLWVPHFNIPLSYKGKLLITVHDIFPLVFPHRISEIHKRLYAKIFFRRITRKASSIITPSNFTKNQLLSFYGNYLQNKITVIHNGVTIRNNTIGNGRKPHDSPYFLAVGNIKPHKNIFMLLEAFEKIMEKIPHDLILVGKKDGFITGDNRVLKKVESLRNRVKLTGFIEESILHEYYNHADALIFPSLYEGFGLPPLEAMSYRCPVLVSNIPPLREVCGDAAVYFNPLSKEDLADNILRFTKFSPQKIDFFIRKGLRRIENFSWERSGQSTGNVIKSLINIQ